MRTLVPDPPPAEFEELLQRRRLARADRHDEVWDGVLHMVPAPSGEHADVEGQLHAIVGPLARQAGLTIGGPLNLGADELDFRVPDVGLHRSRPRGAWHLTVALAAEIVSPGDETWDKLRFYAAHHVDELLIIDPAEHAVHWLALDEHGDYQAVERSGLIDLGPAQLAEQLDWP